MGVKHLRTQGLKQTASDFKTGIKEFNDCVEKMNKTTRTVLDSWAGEGKNEFETQTRLMSAKLDDISDTLLEIYNALIEADTAYLDADEAVAKQISAAGIDGSGASGGGNAGGC